MGLRMTFLALRRLSRPAKGWTLPPYTPPEYTDDLSPVDAGIGAQIKYWFGVYLDEWLWENENIDKWDLAGFTHLERELLLLIC